MWRKTGNMLIYSRKKKKKILDVVASHFWHIYNNTSWDDLDVTSSTLLVHIITLWWCLSTHQSSHKAVAKMFHAHIIMWCMSIKQQGPHQSNAVNLPQIIPRLFSGPNLPSSPSLSFHLPSGNSYAPGCRAIFNYVIAGLSSLCVFCSLFEVVILLGHPRPPAVIRQLYGRRQFVRAPTFLFCVSLGVCVCVWVWVCVYGRGSCGEVFHVVHVYKMRNETA